MNTMTLTEFLLARIAEDEASVRGVLAMDARTERDPADFGKYIVDPVIGPYGGQSRLRDVARGLHLARFGNPTRVLAECEAKRRIIEDYVVYANDYRTAPSEFAEGRRHAALLAVARLAETYANHPDYRNEWRP